MVREAGFEAAFTTAPGAAKRGSDVYQLPRFTPWSQSSAVRLVDDAQFALAPFDERRFVHVHYRNNPWEVQGHGASAACQPSLGGQRLKSNLDDYRASAAEQERIADLLRLLPLRGASVLDVGARDGYVSKRLADRFEQVIALDLQLPVIDDPRVRCVKGDITELEMEDGEFDASSAPKCSSMFRPRI